MHDVLAGQARANGNDFIARPTSEFESKEKKYKFT